MLFYIFAALFLILLLLLWQSSNLISAIFGAPPVMTEHEVIITALKLAKIKKGDIFYDLGCGNGQVLIEAAKMGAKATGFEISPYYYLLSKWRTAKYQNIKVRYQNIVQVDLSKAEVVYCYLLPKILKKLSPKFRRELEPGNRLISIGFPIKNLKKSRIFHFNNRLIYFYKS